MAAESANIQFARRSARGAFILVQVLIGPAQAADIVPLKRGYYVSSSVSCANGSNATLSLYTGKSFGATCKPRSVKKIADRAFDITQVCLIRGETINDVGKYEIVSDQEFVLRNKYGEFRSRFCDQSQLPEPWSKIDLSNVIK